MFRYYETGIGQHISINHEIVDWGLARFCEDEGGDLEMIQSDNNPSMTIYTNGGVARKSRSLATSATYLRRTARRIGKRYRRFLAKIPTKLNSANIGTKFLSGPDMANEMKLSGMVKIDDMNMDVRNLKDVHELIVKNAELIRQNGLDRCATPSGITVKLASSISEFPHAM